MNYFIFHEFLHLVIALVVGLVAYALFKQKRLIFLSLVVSLGVDFDHLADYFNYFGLNLQNPVTDIDYFCLSGKLFIPLHAWEFLPVLFILAWKLENLRGVFITIALALTGHYLLDQFSHAMLPLGYSFLFRLSQNFDINAVSWGCRLNGIIP